MIRRDITMEQFKALINSGPRGANISLIREAEQSPVGLEFETEKEARIKMVALYHVRQRLNAQVVMIKRGKQIAMGPGEYIYKPSAKKEQS